MKLNPCYSNYDSTARIGRSPAARVLASTFVSLVALSLLGGCTPREPVTSSIIVNAVVYDGSGGDGRRVAVRFDGDRIAEIGDIAPLDGETVIDAQGLALAPGFIDTHSHHDRMLDQYRHMPAVLSQGVTTFVRGVDGASSGGDDVFGYLTVAAFNARFEAGPAAVNIASYSPHNSIRYQVLGDDNRRVATAAEIDAMATLVRADMEAGALGLATGLEYEPGIFSAPEEVIALARVAGEMGGSYSSHIRDEDDRMNEAVDELLRIGREGGLPVHISHIKLADRLSWNTTGELLAKLDAARAAGIRVSADIYPYDRWSSDLAVLFPDRDFTNAETARFTFERTAAPEDILIVDYAPNPAFNGKTIAEIARITERDVVETLLDLSKAAADHELEHRASGSTIIARSMSEPDIAAFLRWPHMNICSDGGNGGGHPRGYGAFPRVLAHYVREQGILSLPQAIRQMTAVAAENAGIVNRGRIAPGLHADLVLFDPDTVADRATLTDSTAPSVGIEKVWVNGVLAFDHGSHTGAYPGRVVRPGN